MRRRLQLLAGRRTLFRRKRALHQPVEPPFRRIEVLVVLIHTGGLSMSLPTGFHFLAQLLLGLEPVFQVAAAGAAAFPPKRTRSLGYLTLTGFHKVIWRLRVNRCS